MQKEKLSIEEVLLQEMEWFYSFCTERGKYYEEDATGTRNMVDIQIFKDAPLPTYQGDTPYENLIRSLIFEAHKKYSDESALYVHVAERMTLILALMPYINPEGLDYLRELESASGHTVNSTQGVQQSAFIPSAETVLYILAGRNLTLRLLCQSIYFSDHSFAKKDILYLEDTPSGIPKFRGALTISPEYLHLLVKGEEYAPELSTDFPAQRLHTDQSWEDLVVPLETHLKIQELLEWIRHYDQLLENEHFSKERKGYRCLLVGEPGTGKTMLGRLLSKETNKPVYRISLDKIVSKYVGETTKNIARVFKAARNRNWILFCDEGDALFSKRSANVNSAQDTYVNQDIAYLLQEIEDFPGIILVATNYSNNMDKAFQRRFDTRIEFGKPDYSDIITLWEKALAPFSISREIDLSFIAKEQRGQITGAQIAKVKHYLGIQAVKKKSWALSLEDFCEGLTQNEIPVPDFESLKIRKTFYPK
ncbi:MAG: AAA family ATPase [Microscillaceae bacterium]|nr:AAA family ATPase [Microscillaceae bacterium]